MYIENYSHISHLATHLPLFEVSQNRHGLKLLFLTLYVVVVEVESDSQILVTEGSVVLLSCEVYGYPRNSSPPVWTSSQWTSDELQSGRFSTSLTNENRLSDSSVPFSERVVSQLSIVNVTEEDSGEYTCEVTGNSTSISLTVVGE